MLPPILIFTSLDQLEMNSYEKRSYFNKQRALLSQHEKSKILTVLVLLNHMVHFLQQEAFILVIRQARSENDHHCVRVDHLQQLPMKDANTISQGYSLPQLKSARAVDNHHVILPIAVGLRLPHSAVVGGPSQRDLHVIA